MTMKNLRLYSFVNYYLSPLQHGLQTAHCVSNLQSKYRSESHEKTALDLWADVDKTIIILNGGNSAMLRETIAVFQEHAPACNLPFCFFKEDQQSLDGALTAVSIILPDRMWDAKELVGVFVYSQEAGPIWSRLSPAEEAIVRHIRQFKLA